MNEPQEPLPILSYEIPIKDRIWRVGTLTYTLGGLGVLFFWLLWGDFALSMRDRSIGPVVQLMLKKFNSSNTTMGLLLTTLPAFISMILGPIISFRSDHHRGRWGRRIPFLLIPTPIAALSMIGLAYTPELGVSLNHLLGSYSTGLDNSKLIVFGIFWTLFEFAAIIAGSVLGGLINDVVPRELLGRFFAWFRAVSLIAGIMFNRWVMGVADHYYKEIFWATSVLFGVGFIMMCFRVKEGEYPPPEIKANDFRARGYVAMLIAYARECFSQPYCLWMFFAMMFAGLVALPVNMFSLPFSRELKMTDQAYGNILALTYICSLVLAYPLGSLADRFHPLRVGIGALILYMICSLWGMFFIKDATTFAYAFLAHGVLSGTYFTAAASLGQKLFPKLKFGQFGASAGLIGSLANIITPPFIGQILDQSHNDYRLTFTCGFFISVIAVALMFVVYLKFMRLGGMKSYSVPEPRNESVNCKRIAVGLTLFTVLLTLGIATLWHISNPQLMTHHNWKLEQKTQWAQWGVNNVDDLAVVISQNPTAAIWDKSHADKLISIKETSSKQWKDHNTYPLWSILSQVTTFRSPELIDTGLCFIPGFIELFMLAFISWIFFKASKIPSQTVA